VVDVELHLMILGVDGRVFDDLQEFIGPDYVDDQNSATIGDVVNVCVCMPKDK
jgi:hypothetical protein